LNLNDISAPVTECRARLLPAMWGAVGGTVIVSASVRRPVAGKALHNVADGDVARATIRTIRTGAAPGDIGARNGIL